MSLILFLLSFTYYLSGLCGTIPSYRDSGDLIASIHTLGIAHPPGYALYVLIGKLFVTILPFGNVAYRVNVMSAFFAAATVTLLFRLIRNLQLTSPRRKPGPSSMKTDWFPAFAGMTAIVFATSPAVVALARVAEMYTLASFFASGILFCLLEGSPACYSLAALLLGLGLSVHPTLIFLTPMFVAAYRREGVSVTGGVVTPSRRYALTPILSFLLGLSIFLYLPIRASQHPLVNWGDPSSWRNFWRVVARADYGGLKLHPEQSAFSWTLTSVFSQLRFFGAALKGEWGWGALGLGCAGVLAGLKSVGSRRLSAGLLGSWILAGPAFFLLSNLPLQEATTPAILQPYLLLTSLLWAFFVGMGVKAVLTPSPQPSPPKGGEGRAKPGVRGAVVLAVLTVPMAFRSICPSERQDYYAYDYARNLLRSLPQGAVLYDPDDPTHFSIQVLQTVEGRRPDVVLLNFFRTRWGYEQIKRRWPDLLPPVPIDNGPELQRLLWTYSARQRPFFAELPQKLTPYPYHAEGLVYAAQEPSSALSRRRAEALLELVVQRGDFVTLHHSDFFTSHLISYYSAAQNNLGIEYAGVGDWRRAIAHYRAALQIEPNQRAAQDNLTVALQKM